MRLGLPVFLDMPELADCMALCEALGMDFVELNKNLPQYAQLTEPLPPYMKGKVTLHMDEPFDPWHFHPTIAKAHLQVLHETLVWARDNKVNTLTLHMNDGVYFTLPEGKINLQERYQDLYLQQTVALRQVAEQVTGPIVCIENAGRWTAIQQQAIELLLESECFGLTWDIGHDARSGGVHGVFMQQHAQYVRHMHLHDNGPAGNHLPLGDGNTDLAKPLAFAQQHDLPVVIEVKTPDGLRKSINWLHERGY